MLVSALWATVLTLAAPGVTTARGAPINEAQVIILGGGITGISLARSLIRDHNVTDILLLEARDELGGRAHTDTLYNSKTGANVTVERGCNWIQGPGKEPILELAEKWGLETARQNYSNVAWWGAPEGENGHFLDLDEQDAFMASYDEFLEQAPTYSDYRTNNSFVDISVRVATSILDWIPLTPLQWAYEYWNIDYTFAQTPEESSFANAFSQEAGIELEVDDFVIDQRGYKYIFVQEARELFGQKLDDKRLQLSTTVQSVDYSKKNKIVVKTDKGSFSAPHVISTFSVGVLQNQDVKWVPTLPDWKKEAIFTFAMATYQKIFLMFEKQFWGPEEYTMYADPDQRGRYTVWQNINAPGFFPQNTTNNVFMVTATGSFARRNEELSDEEVQAETMGVLREIYGASIPEPVDILVPRWTLDPLYRGSYSNWPLGALDEHHANLGQPITQGGKAWLHFTGEAMSDEYFGYVQGGWDQGLKTATAVASCLKGQCPSAEVYTALTTCEQSLTTIDRRAARRRGGTPKRHGSPGHH